MKCDKLKGVKTRQCLLYCMCRYLKIHSSGNGKQITEMNGVLCVNNESCLCVYFFSWHGQWQTSLDVCESKHLRQDTELGLTVQSVRRSTTVYTFPTVDLNGQCRWNVHRGLFVQGQNESPCASCKSPAGLTLWQPFNPPDVLRFTAARLKADQDRAECCEELSEEASPSAVLDDEMWRGVELPQTNSRGLSPLTVNCLG